MFLYIPKKPQRGSIALILRMRILASISTSLYAIPVRSAVHLQVTLSFCAHARSRSYIVTSLCVGEMLCAVVPGTPSGETYFITFSSVSKINSLYSAAKKLLWRC